MTRFLVSRKKKNLSRTCAESDRIKQETNKYRCIRIHNNIEKDETQNTQRNDIKRSISGELKFLFRCYSDQVLYVAVIDYCCFVFWEKLGRQGRRAFCTGAWFPFLVLLKWFQFRVSWGGRGREVMLRFCFRHSFFNFSSLYLAWPVRFSLLRTMLSFCPRSKALGPVSSFIRPIPSCPSTFFSFDFKFSDVLVGYFYFLLATLYLKMAFFHLIFRVRLKTSLGTQDLFVKIAYWFSPSSLSK